MEEEYQAGTEAQEILPIEQGVILFYGRPIIVVRLPNGQPAVVIRSLCENMQLDRLAQVRRIQRTAPIAQDLLGNVRIETDGGPQRVQVLILRSVPYWLTGIDYKRVRSEMQEEVLRYQCEAVDALYAWAQQPRALPAPSSQVLPAELVESSGTTAIARPGPGGVVLVPMEEPGQEATHREKAAYHELMSVWHRHQADLHVQVWRSEVEARIEEQEARIEAKEAVTDLIPEILDRLGPETLTPQHQRHVQASVKRLHEVSGKAYPTRTWNTGLQCRSSAQRASLVEGDSGIEQKRVFYSDIGQKGRSAPADHPTFRQEEETRPHG